MTLPLELGGIQDPDVLRAFEQIAQHFPLQGQTAGRVDSTGTIVAGTGFTVAHPGTGNYTLTFPASFGLVAVTANPEGAEYVIVGGVAGAYTATSVGVITNNLSSVGTDANFSFVAVGGH